ARIADHRGHWARAWPSAREQAVAAVVVLQKYAVYSRMGSLHDVGGQDAVRVMSVIGECSWRSGVPLGRTPFSVSASGPSVGLLACRLQKRPEPPSRTA